MLKMYMVFSSESGSGEGACLVFAHTTREAKRIAWTDCDWEITDYWIDVGVRLIREENENLYEEADQEKLKADIPHVISSPKACESCHLWGYELNDKGYCETCEDITADFSH